MPDQADDPKTHAARAALEGYSRGEMSATDLRRRLDHATYGDLLVMLARENLPLPRAPLAGREDQLARAGQWLFPRNER